MLHDVYSDNSRPSPLSDPHAHTHTPTHHTQASNSTSPKGDARRAQGLSAYITPSPQSHKQGCCAAA
jgi:hypothetical protein